RRRRSWSLRWSPVGSADPRAGVRQRRRRAQADDLMTAQRFEERLEAAADQAPQHRALGLDLSDAGRALHLLSRRGPDEADLDSPNRQFLRHARDARSAALGPASAELPARYRAGLVPSRPPAISEQAGSAHGEAHPAT